MPKLIRRTNHRIPVHNHLVIHVSGRGKWSAVEAASRRVAEVLIAGEVNSHPKFRFRYTNGLTPIMALASVPLAIADNLAPDQGRYPLSCSRQRQDHDQDQGRHKSTTHQEPRIGKDAVTAPGLFRLDHAVDAADEERTHRCLQHTPLVPHRAILPRSPSL